MVTARAPRTKGKDEEHRGIVVVSTEIERSVSWGQEKARRFYFLPFLRSQEKSTEMRGRSFPVTWVASFNEKRVTGTWPELPSGTQA